MSEGVANYCEGGKIAHSIYSIDVLEMVNADFEDRPMDNPISHTFERNLSRSPRLLQIPKVPNTILGADLNQEKPEDYYLIGPDNQAPIASLNVGPIKVFNISGDFLRTQSEPGERKILFLMPYGEDGVLMDNMLIETIMDQLPVPENSVLNGFGVVVEVVSSGKVEVKYCLQLKHVYPPDHSNYIRIQFFDLSEDLENIPEFGIILSRIYTATLKI